MATDLTPIPKGQLRNVDMYGQGCKTETDDGKWVDLLRRLGKKKQQSKMHALITVRQSQWIFVSQQACFYILILDCRVFFTFLSQKFLPTWHESPLSLFWKDLRINCN